MSWNSSKLKKELILTRRINIRLPPLPIYRQDSESLSFLELMKVWWVGWLFKSRDQLKQTNQTSLSLYYWLEYIYFWHINYAATKLLINLPLNSNKVSMSQLLYSIQVGVQVHSNKQLFISSFTRSEIDSLSYIITTSEWIALKTILWTKFI